LKPTPNHFFSIEQGSFALFSAGVPVVTFQFLLLVQLAPSSAS